MGERRTEQKPPQEAVVVLNQRFSLFDRARTSRNIREDGDGEVEYSSALLLRLPDLKPLPLAIELALPTNVYDGHEEPMESAHVTLLSQNDAEKHCLGIEVFSKTPEGQSSRRFLSVGKKHFSAPVYALLENLGLDLYFPENDVKEEVESVISNFNSISFSALIPILGVSTLAGQSFNYSPTDTKKMSGIQGEFVLRPQRT